MNTQFGQNTSLTNATITDIRRVLVDAFASRDFFAVDFITNGWKTRCAEGHPGAARILPIVERARIALAAARAGQPYAFEG
jgi:hypothetical protein